MEIHMVVIYWLWYVFYFVGCDIVFGCDTMALEVGDPGGGLSNLSTHQTDKLKDSKRWGWGLMTQKIFDRWIFVDLRNFVILRIEQLFRF